MEKEIDVITLCKKLDEMTKQEKCAWKDTSEKNRYKLSLKNGTVEIYHYSPSPIEFLDQEYYEVSLLDNTQYRYATYKGESTDSVAYKTFSALYKEVRNLLEKRRRRKMALLFDELEASEDKKLDI